MRVGPSCGWGDINGNCRPHPALLAPEANLQAGQSASRNALAALYTKRQRSTTRPPSVAAADRHASSHAVDTAV